MSIPEMISYIESKDTFWRGKIENLPESLIIKIYEIKSKFFPK